MSGGPHARGKMFLALLTLFDKMVGDGESEWQTKWTGVFEHMQCLRLFYHYLHAETAISI